MAPCLRSEAGALRSPARRRAAALLSTLAVVLSGCGGAPDAGIPTPAAVAVDSGDRVPALAAASADAPSAPASSAAPPAAATSAAGADVAQRLAPAEPPALAAYDLRLVDQGGWHRDAFELVAVRGAGYPTLNATVVVRGASALAPFVGVQPHCATAVRCEYVPPRKGEYARRYTVSLSDDSVARLSAATGTIAISGRYLRLERPSIVGVTLTVDGEPPVTKQITYAKSTD